MIFYLKNEVVYHSDITMTVVEEFWQAANFPLTANQMKDTLKSGRMAGEFIILTSQSPVDALSCPISEAIKEQTVTKIFFPNSNADTTQYKDIGLNLTEIEIVKSLSKLSRKFLIKQNDHSVLIDFDLSELKEFLPILSPTLAQLKLDFPGEFSDEEETKNEVAAI